MSRFLCARLGAGRPYQPGEQPQRRTYVKLNTNESPFPPSPAARAALAGAQAAEQLNRYPDPACGELAAAIARRFGLATEQVLPGNGSDELLAFCFLAFTGGARGAAFPAVSYGFYPVFASLAGADALRVPLREDYTIAPEDYFGLGRMIVLASPNAPTGIALTRAQVEAVVRENPDAPVVVDEAYVDFGAESAVPLIARYDNLIVVQTFSKSRSLAGLRLGMALACPALIADLNAVKYRFNPYNVSRPAQLAGAAAIADEAYFAACTERIRSERARTEAALRALGFFVLPSQANFLFARHDALPGRALYEGLRARGVLVRHFDAPETAAFVRISIGTRADMDALLTAVRDVLNERGVLT